jgi:LacI family transcriptional regulator
MKRKGAGIVAASLADIARTAGVSPGTVSHVLNGNKSARIAQSTQDRIRKIARDLDYRPNAYARSIARRRTNTLRLICSSHDNPFFVRATKAVDINTRKAGYKLWVDATLNDRMYYGPGEEVGIWPVDGALLWANAMQDLAELLGGQAQTIPVVYVGYQDDAGFDIVTYDLYHGGRLAVEHLVERGYRRIAYLALESHRLASIHDRRIKAYEDVCRAAGLPIMHLHIPDQRIEADYKLNFETGRTVAAMPDHERPDAVICLNDIFAIAFCNGVRRAGLRVPDDIAVIGFDGIDEGRYLDVPLTSVAIPLDDVCKAAIDLLIQRIRGDRETPPQRLVFPTELIVGSTT